MPCASRPHQGGPYNSCDFSALADSGGVGRLEICVICWRSCTRVQRRAIRAYRLYIHAAQIEIRYLQEAGDGCQMGCFEMLVPPGSNVPPPHSHTANEELVYVLEGTLRYSVGSETREVTGGTVMWAPAELPHGVDEALEPTVMLVAMAPPPASISLPAVP